MYRCNDRPNMENLSRTFMHAANIMQKSKQYYRTHPAVVQLTKAEKVCHISRHNKTIPIGNVPHSKWFMQFALLRSFCMLLCNSALYVPLTGTNQTL